MDEAVYIESRLDDQIDWYERKSTLNKRRYQGCQFLLLALAALITLSALIDSTSDYSRLLILVPVMGALIALITGILRIYKYQENWTTYRTTAELLKYEKYMFITKTRPYDGSNAFNILVQRVEGLISKENAEWMQYMSKDESQQN
ncbi:MAG: DUF4231 domain-containing protein [Maribacter sp.]|nr:DUF4231 domain-containing protein [Bacteroidia bacterium]NNK76451.1 DUF4231 domain-containing protein [Maribacter sp.]